MTNKAAGEARKGYEKFTGKCLSCGYQFEFASYTSDGDKVRRRDGDISFCINCSATAEFSGNGLKPVDEKELPIEVKAGIEATRQAWLKVKYK